MVSPRETSLSAMILLKSMNLRWDPLQTSTATMGQLSEDIPIESLKVSLTWMVSNTRLPLITALMLYMVGRRASVREIGSYMSSLWNMWSYDMWVKTGKKDFPARSLWVALMSLRETAWRLSTRDGCAMNLTHERRSSTWPTIHISISLVAKSGQS